MEMKKLGANIAKRSAIIAITTSSSINVKPLLCFLNVKPQNCIVISLLLFTLFPLPLPKGWSITFILTADVLGHNLLFDFLI